MSTPASCSLCAFDSFIGVPANTADIYRRLSQGLDATDRETGIPRYLGRSDAAQIAMTALLSVIEGSRSR